MSFDVIAMGRVGVDIYPLQVGVRLPEVETFGKFLGGSAANVAVAAARHGRSVALISRTGADPFGEYVHRQLRGYNVDDRWVSEIVGPPTPVTFCEILPPNDFPLYFYRHPTTPDLQIAAHDLDLAEIAAAGVFWSTGTGLCTQPSRDAQLAALRHRARTGITVLDLDYRPMFWPSREHAREAIKQALPYATIAVGNLDECLTAVGVTDPDGAADALLAHGVDLAVVKQGSKGVLARTPTQRVEVAPLPVTVVNGLGAGDSFGGALCHGLLSGWPLERTIRFANAAGAIVARQLACAPAMPTTDEVERTLEAG
jgi:5-dehydro-2-deoxygluconokinase